MENAIVVRNESYTRIAAVQSQSEFLGIFSYGCTPIVLPEKSECLENLDLTKIFRRKVCGLNPVGNHSVAA